MRQTPPASDPHRVVPASDGTPWGHKIITYTYVPGPIEDALRVAEAISGVELPVPVDFEGQAIEVVATQPHGQDGV